MSGKQRFVKAKDYEEARKKSEAEFIGFLEIGLDDGWSEAECPNGCIVEPDGVCPRGYESLVLNLGFIADGRINRKAIQNYGSIHKSKCFALR